MHRTRINLANPQELLELPELVKPRLTPSSAIAPSTAPSAMRQN